MEKKMMFLIGVVCILASALVMALSGVTFTGNYINEMKESYTYTKAICNADNECIDVLVRCENGAVLSLIPVTEFVRFDDSWEDLRDEEQFC